MPKTLLLADDSVVIQKLVGLSFANEDFNLISTDNGDDAVARAQAIRPDIVLADVVMPGQNGYQVCAALKADPELAQIPVLLLTGTFESFDEARAQESGAAGHISKPFEAQNLVERVKSLLADAPGQRPETHRISNAPENTSSKPGEDITADAVLPTSSQPSKPIEEPSIFDLDELLEDPLSTLQPRQDPTAPASLSRDEEAFFADDTLTSGDFESQLLELTQAEIGSTNEDAIAQPQVVLSEGNHSVDTAIYSEWGAQDDEQPPRPTADPAATMSLPEPNTSPEKLNPILQGKVHETLERIAWEALADLNDTIVRQVVERIEAVAWEVIPQMAEILVKEEIERLKAKQEE